MLLQVSNVAWVFRLTVELLPLFRLTRLSNRVAPVVDFVFVYRHFFVAHRVFGIGQTAVEAAVPLEYDAVVANVEGGHVLGMIGRSFRLKSDRGPYTS